MGLLCDLCFAFDDAPRAAALRACLEPYAELFVVHDLVRATAGSVESLLGELALVQREPDRAVAHYEHALERAPMPTNGISSITRPAEIAPRPDPHRR